jgi:hypothetical protein
VNLTRRELLEMTAALALFPSTDGVEGLASDTIRAYSAEGNHRTATAVDRASADALLKRARAAGASASLQPFELSRVDTTAAFMDIRGQRIEGLPMFDGAFTHAAGVTGIMGPVGGDRPIGWTTIAPNAEAALRKMREGSRHIAIVAVTTGGHPGLCPVNAAWFSDPFGPPVLQVSSEQRAAIEAAAESAAEIRVVALATRTRAQAFNVVAEIRGSDPALAPVCVMTPRSGWGPNASERGGGIVCWLETIHAVKRPRRTVRFIASSGHELGHLGLHDYLRRNPTLARGAHAWVHFGANIGASTGDVGMTASDDAMRGAALSALAPHGLEKIRQSPVSQVAGEAATIRDEHGRFVSFIGRNDWFHNPRDRWPDVVNVGAIAAFARAAADLTLSLIMSA